METPPDPPDAIPTYVADGLERQDKKTLRAVIRYSEQLIKWLDRDLDEEQLGDAGEEVLDVEESEDGALVTKKVTCGKDCGGCPHGPYNYLVTRDGDSLTWEYKGPASE